MIDIKELIINLRRKIHKNAEKSLEEYKTQQEVINFIKEFLNIKKENIKILANTGIIVKLNGLSDKLSENPKNIMFRTELDALPIKEINNLEFKSNTKFSHMCGHDGHIAILLYGMYLIKKDLKKIPKNCSINFIFQPGEEGYGGSMKMIKDGCLSGIDEIYAIHNACFDNEGDIFIKEGPVLCGSKRINISFDNKDNNIENNVLAVCEFNYSIEEFYSNFSENEKKLITFCFPLLKGSKNYDSLPNSSSILGYVRSLDMDLLNKFEEKMYYLLKYISNKYNLNYTIKIKENSSNPVYNDSKLTKRTTKILKDKFKNVSDKNLPSLVSDDFSYYQKYVPGVYFLLANGYSDIKRIHSPYYEFNENLILKGGQIWHELALKTLI